MRQLFISIGLALLMVSCQERYDDLGISNDDITEIDELAGIEHDIMVNILASRFGGYHKNKPSTRSIPDVTLNPFIENGDTLLYVAQYKDGWEIYSTCHATDMILFSSDTGVFDLNDPNMPCALKDIIIESADYVKQTAQDKIQKVHPSWKTAVVDVEDLKHGHIIERGEGKSRAITYPEAPTGRWILLKSEIQSESIYESPKLTITKWDQDHPWNKYSKYVMNDENKLVAAPVGCVVVAVGQYMYYTHFYNGVPYGATDTAIPNNNGTDFTFSGNNPNQWNEMALVYEYWNSGLDETAIFLGGLGRKLETTYKPNGSSVSDNSMIKYLNSIYGTSFSIGDFDYSYVEKSLISKYPVLIAAITSKNSDGTSKEDNKRHTFLIDRYKQNIRIMKYTYGLIRDPWTGPGPDPFMPDKVDENGNILQYAYTKEMEQTYTESSISMNWGFSGYYDNTFFRPGGNDWSAGGHIFNLSHKIFKRADIK